MYLFFFCKQKTAYEMRISDWSSDVCSSDLPFTIVHSESPCAIEYAPTRAFASGWRYSASTTVPESVPLPRPGDVGGRGVVRSEERRVGKACVSRWRSRWSTSN